MGRWIIFGAVAISLMMSGPGWAGTLDLPDDAIIIGSGGTVTIAAVLGLTQGTSCVDDNDCPGGQSCLQTGSCDEVVSGTGVCKELVQSSDLTITYDSAVVTAGTVSTTPLSSGCSLESNTPTPGTLSIALACPSGICGTAGSGDLLEIEYQGVAEGTSALSFSTCQFNEGTPACTATGGNVTVTGCVTDVDDNGVAEVATDIVYIARHLLGLSPVPSSFRDADPSIPPDEEIATRIDGATEFLDVDQQNGTEVATDVVYIARHLLGLSPVPSSFRDADPTIPPDEEIAARIDALCP